MADSSVSHVFIHLSDRFARPELAAQAMQMEIDLLLAGITVVFSNRVSHARQRGRTYFAEDVQMLFEYSQNGEFLIKLSQRVLETQLRLAQGGYWNGGTPPYGFGRVLVDAQGNEIRELAEGEVVKREGCHVRIKPKEMEKIRIWLYILDLYGNKEWGHRRIANHLTDDLGIPSPNAGKLVKRKGKLVPVSGSWWSGVIKGLIRNEAILGMCAYGKTAPVDIAVSVLRGHVCWTIPIGGRMVAKKGSSFHQAGKSLPPPAMEAWRTTSYSGNVKN